MPDTQVLCQYIFADLKRDLAINGGQTIKAGTRVLLLPQTTAQSVRVPGNMNLAEAWESLSKDGHTHPDDQETLAGYQTELIRLSDRLTAIEAWAVRNGYEAPSTDIV